MNTRENILNELLTISHLLHREFDVLSSNDERFEGLTGKRAGLLNYIVEVSEKRYVLQRELEEKFTIRRSTATQLLQELEKYGYITRSRHEDDLRQRVIIPTRKAIECHDIVMEDIEKTHRKMTRDFTDEDFVAFRSVTEKIINNLRD